ncbi:MAG: AAA family ATPase [Microcystaceae cyanobacterium]
MSDSDLPRLSSFTLDGWPVLGGPVTITLNDGVAVLVGRNGAGKSAILEGFKYISSLAIGRKNFSSLSNKSIPKILKFVILTPTYRHLVYRYEVIEYTVPVDELELNYDTNDDIEGKHFSCKETCQYMDGKKELIWTAENGIKTFYQEKYLEYSDYANYSNELLSDFVKEAQWIYSSLKSINLIGKFPVRQTSQRYSSSLYVVNESLIYDSSLEMSDRLSIKIHVLIKKGNIEELKTICQRVGIGTNINEKKFFSPDPETYYLEVFLDNVNLGLLSDGTLRILSIIVELINSNPTSTLMIEEPETQIHPGMLEKLLNEIESYTYGKNLIISTHSPQVVSWTQPDKINLVYRENNKTFVRKLATNEIKSVVQYLNEEGDLGDWIYSGILDE